MKILKFIIAFFIFLLVFLAILFMNNNNTEEGISLDNNIIFPVSRDRDNDKFRRLKFDGIDFYIRLFGPDKEDPNYRAYTDVSIKTSNLQLVNDYDVEVFE